MSGIVFDAMIVRKKAFARVGLIGNPSDGYYGKTISFAIENFHAQVVLYKSSELKILPYIRDRSHYQNIHALVEDVKKYGYYGGIRLLKATIKCFYEYCMKHNIELSTDNFTIRYHSNIPHMVGLAGSSAIVTACLRALMEFYGVAIPKVEQPQLILSVERDEIGISAGLQDRVIQVYQGVVYMDFEKSYMEKHGHGKYEELSPALLPPLYVAYRTNFAEGSEIFHNNIKERFLRNDPQVLEAIEAWKQLTDDAKNLLLKGEGSKISTLLNKNFDWRAKIYKISEDNLRIINVARSTGASAKFTGSGGAIVGTYEDAAMFEELQKKLGAINARVFKPIIAPPTGDNMP